MSFNDVYIFLYFDLNFYDFFRNIIFILYKISFDTRISLYFFTTVSRIDVNYFIAFF